MFVQHLLTSLKNKPPLVVGIDPDLALIHPDLVREFVPLGINKTDNELRKSIANLYQEYGKTIIDAISDLVPVVKPQSAFFETLGHDGIRVFENVIDYAHQQSLLVIVDVKRGDVPSTAKQYANAYMESRDTRESPLFEENSVTKQIPPSPLIGDAITINPYLGMDSLEPFFQYSRPNPTSLSSGLFVLLKTSNLGSDDLQDLPVKNKKLYQHIASLLSEEIIKNHQPMVGEYCNVGAVVGATFPDAARSIRKILPHSFLLVPGLGAQQGDIGQIGYYLNPDKKGALFCYSRSIIYPQQSFQKSKYTWKKLKQEIRQTALRCITTLEENFPN